MEIRFLKQGTPNCFGEKFVAIASAGCINTGIEAAAPRIRVFFLSHSKVELGSCIFFNPRIAIEDELRDFWEDGSLYSAQTNDREDVFLSNSKFLGRCQIRSQLHNMKV